MIHDYCFVVVIVLFESCSTLWPTCTITLYVSTLVYISFPFILTLSALQLCHVQIQMVSTVYNINWLLLFHNMYCMNVNIRYRMKTVVNVYVSKCKCKCKCKCKRKRNDNVIWISQSLQCITECTQVLQWSIACLWFGMCHAHMLWLAFAFIHCWLHLVLLTFTFQLQSISMQIQMMEIAPVLLRDSS